MKRCDTLDDFIEAIGGTNAAAGHYGTSASNISNMRTKGQIPPRFHARTCELAEEFKIEFDSAHFCGQVINRAA